MSVITRVDGTFVPLREQRTTSGTIAALNAEVVHAVNGDESAVIQVSAGAAVTATLDFQGSIDGGVNYFPLIVVPYYALTGTLPVLSQPLITEAFSAVAPLRVYTCGSGGLTNIRVRCSAYTSGNLTVRVNSGPEFSIHPNQYVRPTTLGVTATGAASAAVTATLPAVTGLRHYIDFIDITRSATVVLTAAATPIVVTTTNLPGSPAFTFGADAAAIGVDKTVRFDPGSNGFAALLTGAATTIVAPVATGSIWRINVGYRLDL